MVIRHGCSLFFLVVMVSLRVHAEVQVSVDRNPVMANESFRLTIQSDEKIEVDPDLSKLLENFEVLGRSRHSNIKFINGDWRRSTNIILNLIARTPGEYIIPSISVGDQKTEPLNLRVLDTAPDNATVADIFLEVEVDKKTSLVQEQILLTVRLLRTVEISKATLSEPKLSEGAVIQELGKDRNYHLDREGRRFAVIERQFAIYPQASGELEIAPFVFDGQVITGGRSFFDPFGQSITSKRLESEPLTLQIEPVPAAFTGDTWLPARALEINEVWSDDRSTQWTVGTPVTRTVAIIARGLTAGQLPELEQHLPVNMKAYPEPPALNDQAGPDGVIGVRQEKIALIPSAPGEILLPEIRLKWWNTHTNSEETAVLPARTVSVVANASSAVNDLPGSPEQLPAVSHSQTDTPEARPAMAPAYTLWKISTLILAIGWIFTLAWFWRRSKLSENTENPAKSSKPQGKMKFRELCHLIENSDPGDITRRLIQWSGQEWPNDPPRSLEGLASRVSTALAYELKKLSSALYGRSTGGIDKEALLRELNSWYEQRPQTGTSGNERSTLEPLFKHGSGQYPNKEVGAQ